MDLVSVIIPCYNCEEYISETLDSILLSSYENLEVVLVDDKSTDRTVEIIEDFIRDTGVNILLLKNDSNRGISFSLNRAVSSASGRYIARVDSDDLVSVDRFLKQLEYLNKNTEFSMVFSNCRLIDSKGSSIGESIRCFHRIEFRDLLMLRNCFTSSTMFARRDVLLSFPFDENLLIAEDYDLWCRISSAGHKIGYLPGLLVSYRIHERSITFVQSEKWNYYNSIVLSSHLGRVFGDVDEKRKEKLVRFLVSLKTTEIDIDDLDYFIRFSRKLKIDRYFLSRLVFFKFKLILSTRLRSVFSPSFWTDFFYLIFDYILRKISYYKAIY